MTLLQREILGLIAAIAHAAQSEISINCDHHHGTIGVRSQYRHHEWVQPELKAFVPGLWKANGSHTHYRC